VSGLIEEKHVNSPPAGKIEKKTGLYTLIVNPDNTFEMLINNESVKKGSLLKDFTPSVEPVKEIEDETDVKPADWIDDAKISDESAEKPDDWV
jgi:calnexin